MSRAAFVFLRKSGIKWGQVREIKKLPSLASGLESYSLVLVEPESSTASTSWGTTSTRCTLGDGSCQ